ncbi:SET domain-containing protein 5 [Pseudocercospora fuligena]|uniref:SET domain-containing protein 5 n=1 Tax=Pseudocercospora fuligena TaxID=685502 RepID=A0A8H6VRS9_9PEZI|nr:SET domain-containing protein 5 [Pseudocercospora fuligena]
MTKWYEIKALPGKGNALVAVRALTPGTVILNEAPIMSVPMSGNGRSAESTSESAIMQAFDKLSAKQQKELLTLHANSGTGLGFDHKTPMPVRIFRTNAIGNDTRSRVFLDLSRVNHSCLPNASVEQNDCVIADKHIGYGEEITIDYRANINSRMKANQRALGLQLFYEFKCDCVACHSSAFQRTSDMRRTLINALTAAVFEGTYPPIYPDGTSEYYDADPQPLRDKLTATQRTEYQFLLAKLYEAEGLSGVMISTFYHNAAESLLQFLKQESKHNVMKDITSLEAAYCIKTWADEAIRLLEYTRGPTYPYAVYDRQQMKKWQENSVISIALDFLKMNSNGWEKKELRPFALTMDNHMKTEFLFTHEEYWRLIMGRVLKRRRGSRS